MELPIKFPNDADVIAEEAAIFRALSADERLRRIRGMLRAGVLIKQRSSNAELWRQYKLEQEELAQQAVKEFIARHAR